MDRAFHAIFADALDRIDARGERRQLRPTMAAAGGLRRDGRVLLDFASNDYLGLSRHPLLAERSGEWARRLGSGAGASRLVTGTGEAHLAVEARVAAFKRTEAALLFASGWQANAAAIPALAAAMPGLQLFADRLIHASLHAGIAAAGLRQRRFRHNDLDHLDALLAGAGDGPRLIVTESVFSMDGDRADLSRLTAIARRHGALLFVDEAHATGVLGPEGRGLSAAVPGGVDLVMGTFSKAFGSFGAYLAGDRLLIDYLAQTAGGFVFTTALPPPVLGAIDAALDLVPAMEAERRHLQALGHTLRAGLARIGIDTARSSTQIVPAIVGSAGLTVAMAERLEAAGVLAGAIRPPTVPRGTSRLRLALRAGHDEQALALVLDTLQAIRADRPAVAA